MTKMLTFLSNVLRYLTVGVSAIIDGISSLIYSAWLLNFVFVRALCDHFIYLLNYAMGFITNILFVFHCSIRDFSSFIYDLLEIFTAIISTFNYGFAQLWLGYLHFTSSFLKLLSLIWRTFESLGNLLFYILSLGLHGLVGLANLVGSSIKLLVTLFPATFAKLHKLLFKICELFIDQAIIGFDRSLKITKKIIKNAIHIATNQAGDVYLGILTVLVICWAYKHRDMLRFSLFCLKSMLKFLCRLMGALVASIFVMNFTREETTVTAGPSVATTRPAQRAQVAPEVNASPSRAARCSTPVTPKVKTTADLDAACKTVTELTEELERLRESQMCVICQENDRNIILLPCRHICMCGPCLRILLQNQARCPVCRSIIHDTLQVYA